MLLDNFTPFPIDAVITWVDGHDPKHMKKRNAALKLQKITTQEGIDPTRVNQCNEITYCVHSIFKFAPWIRKIFIVTNDQVPPIINELRGTEHEKRVIIVDQNLLFEGFEKYLPTFNSLTIESVLWRIHDLSEHFIYFNDDFFLIKPVLPQDFFQNNQVVVRGTWKTQSNKKFFRFLYQRKNALNNLHRRIQEKSAELAGYSRRFFTVPHAPMALKRTTIEKLWIKNPAIFLENLNFPFRDIKQFWAPSLAQHTELKNKRALIDKKLNAVYIHFPIHTNKAVYQKLEKSQNATFICIQSLDLADSEMRDFIFKWLDEKIGIT